MGSGLCSACWKSVKTTESATEQAVDRKEEMPLTVRWERDVIWERLRFDRSSPTPLPKPPPVSRSLVIPSPFASTHSSKGSRPFSKPKSISPRSSVPSLLHPHLTCDSHSDIDLMYTAPLLKYHPGFSRHFQQRYGHLTRSLFNVYKSQTAAELVATQPLNSIPLNVISHIREFHFKVITEKYPPQLVAFFEVYIEGEGGEVDISRKVMETREELGKAVKGICVKEVGRTVERGRLVRKPVRTCEEYGGSSRAVSEATWSYREVDWYVSEKRLLFSAESPREVQLWTDALLSLCSHIRSL